MGSYAIKCVFVFSLGDMPDSPFFQTTKNRQNYTRKVNLNPKRIFDYKVIMHKTKDGTIIQFSWLLLYL